ncbi:helix-turn-helix domain-containing protein [Haloplanus rubicundus]|uniref:Helix-turn-helix domain-containing protein n=1 Tax=Haloplanus rubicundus TaxID=1547898 RepID=A0A345EF40_9EURY|nr:helix-turn-helix domain-containing protein [Haloplanus rubicundus]AXG10812.1 helix-turn-helix domain-containing protein [Haloplanus rubicundus]
MPYAKLTIDLPEAVWIGEVSREFPSTTFRVLSAVPSGDAGFGLLEIEGESIPPVLDAIEGRAGISAVELMQRTEDTAVVQFETSEPLLLLSIQESGAPIELPLTIRDGKAVIELTASRDRLSEFGRQLEAFGMSYTLNRVYDAVDTPTLLTDQQRRLLVTAAELGYYDTPRECTLTELAEEVDLAKSTASVTLHRAEETVVKEFVAERLDVTLDEQPQAV